MATKTAKKPLAKPAKAKPAAAKKAAAPAAKKPAPKPVVKAEPASRREFETAPVKSAKPAVKAVAENTFGWRRATALWWAVCWRQFALGISVWLLVAVVTIGAAYYGVAFNFDQSSWSYRLFQMAVSEYIGFMVLWVVTWLVVRKGTFRSFSIELETLNGHGPAHSLDAVLPFTWSLYWRLLALRMVFMAALIAMITLGGFFAIQGGIQGNTGLLAGMSALAIALGIMYLIGQVAIFKWFASHTAYKRFNLFIKTR